MILKYNGQDWLDAIGRPWQLSTVQFDFTLPRRFELALARAIDGERMQTTYTFVAELREPTGRAAGEPSNELVAFLSLSQVFRGPFQNAFAGWRVSTPHCGKGIGREAVKAMLDIAFDPLPLGLGLHRVQANVIPTNEPSLKLAQAVGFREEGYAIKYLEIAGRYQDHVMFAKLAEEHRLP